MSQEKDIKNYTLPEDTLEEVLRGNADAIIKGILGTNQFEDKNKHFAFAVTKLFNKLSEFDKERRAKIAEDCLQIIADKFALLTANTMLNIAEKQVAEDEAKDN